MRNDDLVQAARWHARMEDAPQGASSRAARAGFEAWHHGRANNVPAFSAVVEADGIVRALRDEPALQSLADDALGRAAARNIWRPRWGLAGLVGALVVVPVAALTIRHYAWLPDTAATVALPSQVFSTAIGQKRLVTLADKTRVVLDTASTLTATGSTLAIRGQAAVSAGGSSMHLTLNNARVTIRSGTFNVRVEGDRAAVLAQDADAIATIGNVSPPHTIVVKRGAVLSIEKGGIRVMRAFDPDAITAWQKGWLQFDDVPLTGALREVNRYLKRPIRLSGSATSLRISGSFRTGSGDTFLDAVAATLPVTVKQSAVPPTILIRDAQK